MKTKLLIINKQNPEKSQYIPYKNVSMFLWGRRLSNYIIIAVSGEHEKVFNFNETDVQAIQNKINDYFNIMNA